MTNSEPSRDLPGWLTGPALRFVLMLLMALLGWNITTTLGDIRAEMQQVGQKLERLTVDYPRLETRVSELEVKTLDLNGRTRDLERSAWQQQQPSTPSSTRR